MRTEKQILDLIINFAHRYEQIRGLVLNGSRVNPNVKKDKWQDYDLIYFCRNLDYFSVNEVIFKHFGRPLFMQKFIKRARKDGKITYLMQFGDYIRLDINFEDVAMADTILQDSLTEILLDKDGIFPHIPPPGEESYFIKRPDNLLYQAACNEFIFGIASHLPKALIRGELPLVKNLIEIVLRKPLEDMLAWQIGYQNDYKCSLGKGNRFLSRYLSDSVYRLYKGTYSDYRYNNICFSINIFYQLFKTTAREVAKQNDFIFPEKQYEEALQFFRDSISKFNNNDKLIEL